MEKYEEYFKNQFQTDFENSSFKFDIQKTSQKGIYHIKIFKLQEIMLLLNNLSLSMKESFYPDPS